MHRVAELCDGKKGLKMTEKICEEINCLGGIDNLSVDSNLSVIGKLLRRLRYVLTEKMRCSEIPDIIQLGNYVEFGEKIIHSHLSLKWDKFF